MASDGKGPNKGKRNLRKATPLRKAAPLPSAPVELETPAAAPSSRPIPLDEARRQGLLDANAQPAAGTTQSPVTPVAAAGKPKNSPSADKKANTPLPVSAADSSPEEPEEEPESIVVSKSLMSSWITSMLVHMILLLVLAVVVMAGPAVETMIITLSPQIDPKETLVEEEVVETPEIEVEVPEEVEIETIVEDLEIEYEVVDTETDIALTSVDDLVRLADTLGSDLTSDLAADAGFETTGGEEAAGTQGGSKGDGAGTQGGSGHGTGSELGGRTFRRGNYATPEAIQAIDQGLFWLARHQLADGGWGFDHRVGICQGRCPDPGDLLGARVAATGLALLPFLGSGHTPTHGKYRHRVAAGINFLINSMGNDGSLWRPEGQMYGHGIATLALCECYGMMAQAPPPEPDEDTSIFVDPDAFDPDKLSEEDRKKWEEEQKKRNRGFGDQRRADREKREREALEKGAGRLDVGRLRRAATKAAEYIIRAQSGDGGWRYKPGERGDTSVLGWQIMAMKSAKDAGLGWNRGSIASANGFLNSVQYEAAGDQAYGFVGTRYAYMPNKQIKTEATTAIGVLCRMYMGTSPYHPGMKVAIERIGKRGPMSGDMYYNYYANQIMFQHGGEPWEQWTERLSATLQGSQSRQGHMEGSWFFGRGADHGGESGGRLYATAMACLCLEESFRHLPMFREMAGLGGVERVGDGAEGEEGVGGLENVEGEVEDPAEGEEPAPVEPDFIDFDEELGEDGDDAAGEAGGEDATGDDSES